MKFGMQVDDTYMSPKIRARGQSQGHVTSAAMCCIKEKK